MGSRVVTYCDKCSLVLRISFFPQILKDEASMLIGTYKQEQAKSIYENGCYTFHDSAADFKLTAHTVWLVRYRPGILLNPSLAYTTVVSAYQCTGI